MRSERTHFLFVATAFLLLTVGVLAGLTPHV